MANICEDRFDHLTAEQAIELLKEGIPMEDIPKYQGTRLASNLWFWDHLKLLEGLDLLEVRDGKLFEK